MNPRNLLSTLACTVISLAASPQASADTFPSVKLTFNRAEQTSTAVTDVTVTATTSGYAEGTNISAELVYVGGGATTLKQSTTIPQNVLCIDKNTAENNQSVEQHYVFKISGSITYNTASIRTQAFNAGGVYQYSPMSRVCAVTLTSASTADGTGEDSATAMPSFTDVDITKYNSNSSQSTSNAADWYAPQADAVVTTEDGDTYIRVSITRTDDKYGCFFGLESLTLYQINYNEAVAGLSQYDDDATSTLQQIGQWSDEDIANTLAAITITRDDANVSDYTEAAEAAVTAAVNAKYATLNGKYFTFNKNKLNTSQPFGLISTAGSGTDGALHYSTTFDKNAIWKLIYTSENKFKFYNPATGKYIGLLYNHPENGTYTTTQQNKYILMTDEANAAEYEIVPTLFNAANGNVSSKDDLKGYVGIGCVAITASESNPDAQLPRYLHHGATTNNIVEKDIYLWRNMCGGSPNAASWQYSSWWMHELDESTVQYLLNAVEVYPTGSDLGEYEATEAYTAAVANLNGLEAPAAPTSQDALTNYTVGADIADAITALNGIQLSINMPQTGRYIRIKTAPDRANAALSGTQPYLTSANSTTETSRAAFKDTADASTIFYYGATEEGKKTLCGYDNGLYLYDTTGDYPHLKNSTSAVSNNATYVNFTDATSAEMSTYYFSFHDGSRYAFTNAGRYTDAGSGTGTDAGYRFQLEYVDELPLTLAGGVTTFDVPVAVSIPSELNGAQVFTMELTDEVLHLTEVTSSEDVFPAGTAFVISGGNGTVNFPIDYYATDAAEGGLAANVAASVFAESEDNTSFIQNVTAATADEEAETDDADVTIGFTKLNTGDVVPANAIIVNLPSSNSASQDGSFEVVVADGSEYNTKVTTGISAVAVTTEGGSTAVYDLQGRRVLPSAHGIYIVNGKKIKM